MNEVKSYDRSYDSSMVAIEKWTPKCQICNKGLCQKRIENGKKGERCQDRATMCCTTCNVLVCSVWCWKVLHGYGEVSACEPCTKE